MIIEPSHILLCSLACSATILVVASRCLKRSWARSLLSATLTSIVIHALWTIEVYAMSLIMYWMALVALPLILLIWVVAGGVSLGLAGWALGRDVLTGPA